MSSLLNTFRMGTPHLSGQCYTTFSMKKSFLMPNLVQLEAPSCHPEDTQHPPNPRADCSVTQLFNISTWGRGEQEKTPHWASPPHSPALAKAAGG